MIPWEHLDVARIPGGTEELRLMRRGREYLIKLGGIELMNSRQSGSEEALATLSVARLAGRAAPRLLIGGLGMGFTLRAALAVLGPDATVVVAELIPAVVAWARGPLAELFGGCLDDPRVAVTLGDVAESIGPGPAAREGWDAILLDVDNGPEGQVKAGNDGLYGTTGLAAARRALKPGGVLAVWSVAPNPAFLARMKRAGFATEEVRVRADRGRRGTRHVIWIGTRIDGSAGLRPSVSRECASQAGKGRRPGG